VFKDIQVVPLLLLLLLLLLLDFSRVRIDGNQRNTDGKSCRIVDAL